MAPCYNSKFKASFSRQSHLQVPISRASVVRRCNESRAHPFTWSGEVARRVPLPGAMWLMNPLEDMTYDVHGPSFIIQRGEGIAEVPVKKTMHKKAALSPAVINHAIATAPLMLFSPSAVDVEVVDSEVVEEGARVNKYALSVPPQPQTTAAVLSSVDRPEPKADADVYEVEDSTSESFSPRRTQKIKFTCNCCSTTTFRMINPRAYKSGTVFAQCGHCNVWHKLVDHLKLFHEMTGPVYGHPAANLEFEVPPSLQLPKPFYWNQDLN